MAECKLTYDGTFEGMLCVVLKAVSMRTVPRSIKTDYEIRDLPDRDSYLHIDSDYELADKLYRHLGKMSSPENQQIVMDYFLTSIPEKEKDLTVFIVKSLKYGAYIADDYSDEVVARMQFAIRNLYRESQSYLTSIRPVTIGNVHLGIIRPVNNILPVLRPDLNRKFGDDTMILDSRHNLVYINKFRRNNVIDVRNIGRGELTEEAMYRNLWPYFECDTDIKKKSAVSADSLCSLWSVVS